MLPVLLQTQTNAVLGHAHVYIQREETDILYNHIYSLFIIYMYCFKYTSSTITPPFVQCIISLPCYPI